MILILLTGTLIFNQTIADKQGLRLDKFSCLVSIRLHVYRHEVCIGSGHRNSLAVHSSLHCRFVTFASSFSVCVCLFRYAIHRQSQ